MSVDSGLARHGHVSYLEIPAIDVETSSAFYEAVFGWNVERRATTAVAVSTMAVAPSSGDGCPIVPRPPKPA